MLIGVTVSEPESVTYAVRPSGVIAIAGGSAPTGIALPALRVTVVIGVTVPEPEFTTYAVRPFGVTRSRPGRRRPRSRRRPCGLPG